MTSPLVVGIDLSLTSTGIAASYGGVDRVRSKGSAADTLYQRHDRLVMVAQNVIQEAMSWGTPVLAVIEGPSFASVGGHSHDRSGLWWLVVDGLRELDVQLAAMAPTARCKYATGKGNASKDAVLAAAIRRYPDFAVDGNDIADALLLCAAGADHLGHPLADVPQLNRQALDKVTWPAVKVPA